MSVPVVIAFRTKAKAACGSETNKNGSTIRLNHLAAFGAAIALALVANVSAAPAFGSKLLCSASAARKAAYAASTAGEFAI